MKKFFLPLGLLLGLTLQAQQVDMTIFHGMQPRNIGPAGMSGRVTDIEVVLNDPEIMYIGAAAGGVWQSRNAGHTWTPIFDQELAASIGDIDVYQPNPNIIYVGSGEGNPRNSHNSGWGMFKSIDGGRTWTHLGLELTRQIHRVIIHPENPDIVWVGATGSAWGDSEHRGVYKTTDRGKTWDKVLYVDARTGVADMVLDPHNPNKLAVAMWEHRREPWFFTSGGPGSGIYVSNDAGEHWSAMERGLPEGDLGRIGLAFAKNQKDLLYAYLESKRNAIYRSTDGGHNWERRSESGDEHIGSRPFYYADIYVDPTNENRIYSIASMVTRSEDGGKSWEVFAPGNKIHTDHHAWWSHPTDPDFLIVGHDGGLNITRDRGENWWFADNLPLAQFYHIRVDNERPYNIYGGLQDNGSWVGPSQVRFKGGIRNLYWQRVSVGDGFDVIPDPENYDFGYSMGQAGGLFRYQRSSGQLQRIKPLSSNDEYLRFNWNAGIAIDPFNDRSIYYGSQYVHKSDDHGQSWRIISPDLTTDDPEKQDFLESGGLTYDVTGAENHTSIISIAPSAQEEGVIWVGTDDGNVQLTRDGGYNWTDLTDKIPGVPGGNYVTQITPSEHKAGEAFVVFDDHRRNNWEPYVFRTTDYGMTWSRLVDADDVRGYTYCIAQDPEAPNLLFVGTEFGLYVSFDGGQVWNQWSEGLPTMPIRDMVIHPRDHDLVLGTFGRAIWILDDIRPLREMASRGVAATQEEEVLAFSAPEAYLYNIGESIGYRRGKIGDALYNGENRPYGALITYYLSETQEVESSNLNDMVKIEIQSEAGEPVRHLYRKPKAGINRLNWALERDAPRYPTQAEPRQEEAPRGGTEVLPGRYTVRISYGAIETKTEVEVRADPLLPVTMEDMRGTDRLIVRLEKAVERATGLMDILREAQIDLDYIEQKLPYQREVAEELTARHDSIKQQLTSLKEMIVGKQAVQGIYRQPDVVTAILSDASYALRSVQVTPSQNRRLAVERAEQATLDALRQVEIFMKVDFKQYEKMVLAEGLF